MEQNDYQKIETRIGEFIFCAVFLFKISAIIGYVYTKKAGKIYQQAIAANDKEGRAALYSEAKRLDKIAGNWFTFDMIFFFFFFTLTGIGYLLINVVMSITN